jgi:hypothetical protein
VAFGRHPGDGRPAASVQPDLHHRARHRLGERDVLPALPDGAGLRSGR